LLKSGSLNTHKNAAVPIIVMLGHSKVNTEVSDTDVGTTESDNYKELSGDDGDANNVLAII